MIKFFNYNNFTFLVKFINFVNFNKAIIFYKKLNIDFFKSAFNLL